MKYTLNLTLLSQDKENNKHVMDWVSAHVIPVSYALQ